MRESSACSPVTRAVYPARVSASRTKRSVCGSSSTTRTRAGSRVSGPGPGGRGAGGRALPGLLGHRHGEGEARTLAGAGALGPDAPPVRLHQPPADDEPEARARDRPLAAGGVLAKELRQQLGRHALALVGDRDRDVDAVALGRDPDRGRLRRVPSGVREQVVQHLRDAPAVGHHRRQVRRQVDEHAVPGAGGEERVPRPVHQRRHLRGLGRNRERARLDAPRIEEIADEAAHVPRLLVDDAEELAHLGRVELGRLFEQGVRRAPDRGERGAQLVAHQAQELGA